MTDTTIIWKFLILSIPDDHLAIYSYIVGRHRSANDAINKILLLTEKIFSPPIELSIIKSAIKQYLEYKKKQHKNGEIKIHSIY